MCDGPSESLSTFTNKKLNQGYTDNSHQVYMFVNCKVTITKTTDFSY